MTPEKLVEELKQACPAQLRSILLYGSAAAGDHTGKQSDYNILVVTHNLDIDTLDALAKPAAKWAQAGNPAPLLFTEDRLAQATDVFPVELLDIRDSRKVLYGEDLVEALQIDTKNLRLQIEHELRGKLIQLRQHYLLTVTKTKSVTDLMVRSLSTFLVLFRAALRLFEQDVPPKKLQAVEKLATHLGFDASVFKTVQQLKDGAKKPKDLEIRGLFNTYLKTIECVIDAVDAYIREGESK